MRTIRQKTNRKGNREVTVELGEGEKLMAFHEDKFYRLGYPVEDVIAGHIITESGRVVWDSLEQKWIE